MSFGEAKKVLIARALVHRPRILFIDELCAGLDNGSRKKVLEILELLAGQGTQIIVAAHDHSELPDCVTKIMTLKSGRIVNSGSFLRPPYPTTACGAVRNTVFLRCRFSDEIRTAQPASSDQDGKCRCVNGREKDSKSDKLAGLAVVRTGPYSAQTAQARLHY